MNKLFGLVLVLMIGLGAGVSIGVILLLPQTPQNPNTPVGDIEGRITIEEIRCTFTNNDAELEILLVDNFPQTDLEGNVTIYQDEQEWTGEVDWQFDGSGYVEIKCDSIKGNESLWRCHPNFPANSPFFSVLARDLLYYTWMLTSSDL